MFLHLSSTPTSSSHPPPPPASLTPSMRYSCDPPAVHCWAWTQLKSGSVLLLARVVGLPHSQFTRLPQPLCAQEEEVLVVGWRLRGGVIVQHGWGLTAALELRQCSFKHRMLHKVPGCCCIWLNSPACLAWRVLLEVMWRCRTSARSTRRTLSFHRLVCRPQTTGGISGSVVFSQQHWGQLNRVADLP